MSVYHSLTCLPSLYGSSIQLISHPHIIHLRFSPHFAWICVFATFDSVVSRKLSPISAASTRNAHSPSWNPKPTKDALTWSFALNDYCYLFPRSIWILIENFRKRNRDCTKFSIWNHGNIKLELRKERITFLDLLVVHGVFDLAENEMKLFLSHRRLSPEYVQFWLSESLSRFTFKR